MEVSTGLGDILERLKAASGAISDSDLAKKLGYSQQSIAKAKTTGVVPTSWIPRASLLFNVSTDWLFFGRGPMQPSDTVPSPQPQAQQPETPPETAPCPRCAEMKAELEEERKERRELAQENRRLWQKNEQLSHENGDLREKCATLTERQKTCCPDPLLRQPPPLAPSSEVDLRA